MPTQTVFRRKPLFLDTFVIKDSSAREYRYKVHEYKDLEVVNGRETRWIDLKFKGGTSSDGTSVPNSMGLFMLGPPIPSTPPSEICDNTTTGGFTCEESFLLK